MILIGFNARVTSTDVYMEVPAPSESGPRQNVADRIVAGTREFFMRLGRWESHFLWSQPPRFPDRFIRAEATAVRNLNLKLVLNRELARLGRRPYGTSWLFNRIYELAADPHREVRVWTMPYGPNSTFTGHTDSNLNISLHHLLHGAGLGQTLCHELAIHAWRQAGHGSSGHHRDLFHVAESGTQFPPNYLSHHSLPDTEADILQLILRGSPPRRRIPLEAQRRHDRHVWRLYDSVVSASQGSRTLQPIQDLTPEQTYRHWRMFSPSRTRTGMRSRRPEGRH